MLTSSRKAEDLNGLHHAVFPSEFCSSKEKPLWENHKSSVKTDLNSQELMKTDLNSLRI